MNFLDMRTVFIGYVLSSALGAVVMTSLWLQNRKRYPAIASWLADYVMQFAGLLLIFMRGVVPDFFSIVLANVLILGGTIVLLRGLQRFVGHKTRQVHNYVFLAAFTSVHLYFTYVDPSLAIRSINISIGLLFLCAQGAWLMLRKADPEVRAAARPTGVVFVAFCAVSVVHIAGLLYGPQVGRLFESDSLDAAAILMYQMLYIGLTFALLLLVSRTLLSALERDIAERVEAERELGQSEEKFSVAFQNVPDAIIITLLSGGTIIEANESCFRLIGYSKDEMIGKTTIELGVWDDLADRERYIELLELHGRVAGFECLLIKKSGEVFPGVLAGEIVQVAGAQAVLTLIHDATASKLAEAQLIDLSERDSLTGILNPRAFYSAAAERLAADGDTRIALVYLDLDGLKAINDEFGHPMGDQALVVFASALKSAFRDSDVVGRLGGDEFAVLAGSRENVPDEALMVRFSAALRDKNATEGLPFTISASFGIAWRDPISRTPDLQGLISAADLRMYDAKRALNSSS